MMVGLVDTVQDRLSHISVLGVLVRFSSCPREWQKMLCMGGALCTRFHVFSPCLIAQLFLVGHQTLGSQPEEIEPVALLCSKPWQFRRNIDVVTAIMLNSKMQYNYRARVQTGNEDLSRVYVCGSCARRVQSLLPERT
jgi:hypothetical protein